MCEIHSFSKEVQWVGEGEGAGTKQVVITQPRKVDQSLFVTFA